MDMSQWRLAEFGPDLQADDEAAETAVDFVQQVARGGLANAIPNVSGQLGAIVGPGTSIPYLVTCRGAEQCNISSFTRFYMDGAAYSFAMADNALLKRLAAPVRLSGRLLRQFGLDDLVIVNFNLHPTCHVEDWSGLDVPAVTALLAERYPTRAIWVRGLVDRFHENELRRLAVAGYRVVPSRPIEVLDRAASGWTLSRDLKKDLRTVQRMSGVEVFVDGSFTAGDYAVMAALNRKVLVDRHDSSMPHYTAAFFRACATWSECRIVGLRDAATREIRCFATLIAGPQRDSCGTLGFDTGASDSQQLYAAAMALSLQQSISTRHVLNTGFGGVRFKRNRGTSPALEMNAVYVRHLPAPKRHTWRAVLGTIASVAGPVMRSL